MIAKIEKYTVTNGKQTIILEPAEEGGFVVTSPFDPELVTEAETLAEAFENAADAAHALRESRKKLIGQLGTMQPKRRAKS